MTHMESETSLGIANAKDKPNSGKKEQLVEYHEIEHTPFTVARNDKEWFLLMGKYRLTEAFKTREQAEAAVHTHKWIRLMQVVNIMIIDALEQDEINKKLKKVKTNKTVI